jgi:hypothetical protein
MMLCQNSEAFTCGYFDFTSFLILTVGNAVVTLTLVSINCYVIHEFTELGLVYK